MDLNRRITIKVYGFTKDAIGGVTQTVTSSYDVWAQVENRTGRALDFAQQPMAVYDYKITKRFEIGRETKATYTIEYEGKHLKIETVSFDDERFKKFEVIRATVIETNV